MTKKRFHDIDVWSQDWFLEMPPEYKMLWFWVLDKCDHAGIWKPNKKNFENCSECVVNLDKGFAFFNSEKDRIHLTQKKNWLVIDFFVFQYGTTFNIKNPVHKSINCIYNQELIELRSIRGLKEVKLESFSGLIEDYQRTKDKDKDKDIKEIKEGVETIKRNGTPQSDLKLTSLESLESEFKKKEQ